MPLQKDRISQLSDRLKTRKETESVQSSSEISTRYDRVGALADELTRWGYSTKAPERKTADELFIGGSERAAQIPEYTVPEQKPRFTLPSSAPRTEKNSPTSTTSSTVWGSSNFGSGVQMPTFDSKKLTAGDVAESVGNSAFQGVFGELAHSLYSVAAGAENLFEKYLLGYDDPEELSGIFQSLRDLQAQDYDARQQQITQTSEKSPVMEVVNNLVPDTARNVRDLLLSMATGGAWAGVKAAPAAEQLSRQIMAASQGLGAQAQNYISGVLSNPQFFTTIGETLGRSYNDALDKGASEEQALVSSVLSSIPNALIEVGGGTEDIVRAIGSNQFKGGIQAAMQLGQSALEEAGEEILQDVVSGVIEKGTWDYDRPTFTGNFDAEEDAVYNLARMLESAGYAIAGTVLTAGAGGAIQRGTTRILTDADRVSVGSEIKKADGGNQLLKIAAASESQEVQNQRSEIMGKLRRGQNVSAYSLGKLAESLTDDATINLVESTKRVQTADNTQDTVRNNATISNQSAEGISAIDAEIRRYTTPFVQNAAEAQTVQQQSTRAEMIDELAAQYGENGQKAFRAVMSESDNVSRAQNAFRAFYNYGNWGKRMEDVSSAFADSISSDAAYAAFSAGQNDAAASLATQKSAVKAPSGKGGLVTSSAASTVDSNTKLYLDGIGRALGVQIEIESGERDAQGNLLSNGRMVNGKIYISSSSKKPIASVLNHELTHILQERSPEQYREYKNFVASYLDSQNSGWFESQVQRMIDGYESIGESISREMAEDEVVSDAAERFLSDETAIKELVKENRSVAQKVLDAIRNIIRRLASAVRGDNDTESTASRLLREQEEVFRQAEKMWAKALAESSSKTDEKKTAQNKKSSAKKAEKVRYQLTEDNSSVDERFFKFINRVLNGELNGKNWSFLIGNVTPEVARKIELETDVNPSGYVHKMSVDAVNHIIRRHGENGEADHSMANPADIAQIPYVIKNFTNAELVRNTKGNVEYSKKYQNSDASPAKMIKFEMATKNGWMYVVEAVPESKAKTLWVVSAYATKIKEEGDQVPNGKQKSSLPVYVHDELDSSWPSSDSSISEMESENNRQNVQTSEENSHGRRQLNLDNWRDAMTEEESRRYYQLQDELDMVITDISQTSKRIKAIRDSEEYKSFAEMKKASGQMRGRFAHFSVEDMEEYPFLKELTELRASNNALRARSNELAEEQYPIELKAKERLRSSEADRVDLSYNENSKEAAERREKVLEEYGTTRSWGETGYILKNGEQLNFRGGSSRGSRSVDHREVNQFFDEDDMSPSEAMVAFIKEGNIRVMPEVPGITVAMGTTISDAQEKALGRYISSKGNEIFLVDIINDNGDNLDTLTYERNVKLDKVLRDIRYFLKNGERPKESVTAMFHSRYQLALTDEDEYEFSHAQPDVDYQLEGREDDPAASRSREQDIEAIGLDTGWLDRHVSNAISMDESGTLEDRIETLKKESEVLKSVRVSDDQIKKIAGRVLKEYDSRLDEGQFTSAVKSAVEHIGRRGAKGYEQAFVSIYDEMVRALEQSESLDKSLWDAPDVKEIRKSIRETRLYLSDDQKRDFQNFPEYKRDHREFRLVNVPAALSVDRFYSELAENYPEYFDPDKVSARDMLDEISDWLEAVKPTVVNWYEGNIEQVAADATADILYQVNRVKSRMPDGRLTKQMVAQQQRFAERYRQLKEQYQKKLQKANDRLKLEKERRVLDREKAAEKIQKLKAHNREVKKRASDRRAISQSRKKIERIVDQLSRKLLKPNNTQNVPVELRGAVSGFLQAIDFRSYRGGEVSDTHKTQKWQDLQNVLARISREEDGDGFDGMYFTVDPDMERRMRELMQAGAPVNLSELSRDQMLELEKLVRAVDHMVRFVGKIRVEGQMLEATETARQIIEENSGKIKGITRTTPIALRAKQFFQYDLLDPTRFSDMFGKGFYKIIHNLRMAENDKIRYWSQTESAFEQMLKENGFTKKSVQKMGEDYRDVIIGGKIGKMSTAQIMSLYLANKREQGRSHLYGGGIALPDSTGRVITRHQKTYQLTEEDVSAITGMLSDSQRRLADAMQRFLSDDVAAWGNRMSRYLYGYDKFTEKNYWPISSDPNYTRSEVSLQQSEAKSATIKNLGMTKALVEKASNPIVIDSAFQVFAKHATQMAAYGAYVGPLEDLNKVINWQTRHDGNWRSVRETISAAGGREAIRYLYKLIDDVNGQSCSEGDPYAGLMGAAKAASVAGNLRVVVQQPTAYWRAMAVIPPQYLVKGIAGKRVNVEEMLDTAPVAQWKSWGYFRDGVSGSNLLELMQGKTGVREKFVDWSMSLAGKADDMTWRQIYRAVESWVSGTTDLERGSEAFRQEVGKRFTEVVDRTQVVDSVFQRAQAMRNTGFGWKLATSFMAEPLKSYNLLVGSARNFVNAGKGEKGEALRKMLMAALGFAVSSVINAAVQSAWDVGRDKDPDEKIVEKFMQAMFGDTVNDVKKEGGSWYDAAMAAVDGNLAGNFNPMSMIPVLNDIWSMLEGFDPEVMGLDTISDILSSGQTLYKSVSEGGGKYTAGYNAIQFVRKLSAATGLPVGNIYRELESLVNFSITAAGDWLGMDVERLQFEINKLYLNPDQNRNIYYQSILDARAAGDNDLAVEIANYLLSKGIKRSSIETGLSNLIAKDESNADLISEYAQAYQNRDMGKMSILESEGKKAGLSGLDLQNAAERYLKNLESDSESEVEAEEEFSEQDFESSAEYDTGYTLDVLTDAIVNGDSSTEQQMRSQLKSSGKTDEDIDKSIKSELKSRMAENAGFESVTQMQDAGEEFDTTTKEYQILHDQYGYTQYEYSDLYEALVDGRGYDAIYDDMLGQTSTGNNKFTAEKIEDAMKERLQEDFNTRYKGGTGSGWEFYMGKLKEYGKTWDEILTSWKRSKAGQEWNDSH